MNGRMRLSEEDPGLSGVDPGAQENAGGQWRGRLRARAPRRDLPETATARTREAEDRPTPQEIEDEHQPAESRADSSPLHNQPSNVPVIPKKGRGQPWSNDEKEELMWCYYSCAQQGSTDYRRVFNMWKERNPNLRPNATANTLQTQRRNIERNLTEEQKEAIKARVHAATQVPEVPAQSNEEHDKQLNTEPTFEQIIKNQISLIENTTFDQRKPLRKLQKTPQVSDLINKANEALRNILTPESTILKIDNTAYAAAKVITDQILPEKQTDSTKRKKWKRPPWEHRLSEKVNSLRKQLSILSEYRRRPNNKQKTRKLIAKWTMENTRTIEEVIENLKQRLTATAQRLRRCKKRVEQFHQNRLFQNNTAQFYRSLHNPIIIQEMPTSYEIEQYWKDIYEDEKSHNEEAAWIREYENRGITHMDWADITVVEVKEALGKAPNWKATGLDRIPNFWLKEFSSLHQHLVREYNAMIRTQVIPPWLAKGKTLLVPKSVETKNPKNYRPITCLNVIYKNLTSVIAARITKHSQQNGIIPIEQKGCCAGSRGCKDQLLLSQAITEESTKNKKSLYQAWIDYRKAFDSIPHTWLIKACELAGVHQIIINFCKELMKTWKTQMVLISPNETITTTEIKIKRGIYQGDSLSPLMFCLGLAPLSTILNNTGLGYVTQEKHRISHLLYMDDLKLFSQSKAQLRHLITKTQEFTKDINMQFGIDKCAIAYIRAGQLQEMENIQVDDMEAIKALETGQYYKYLGISESQKFDHQGIKEELKKEYFKRVRKILKSQLNSKNKMTAIGALGTPVIQYSFGIINWRVNEIKLIDTKTRKLLTAHGMLHPRADVDRLYVPRARGGRGLKQTEAAWELEIYSLSKYMIEKEPNNPLIKYCLRQDKTRKDYSLTKQALKTARKLRTQEEPEISLENLPTVTSIKSHIISRLERTWLEKNLHGQLMRDMGQIRYDKQTSFAWLKSGQLKPESESLLTAAQDQAIKTRYIEKRILHTSNSELCRLCKERSETVTHIMSACPVLARKEYIDRHNRVCSQIHFEICRHYGSRLPAEKWYVHKPANVTQTPDEKTTILYDHPVRTDRTVAAQNEDSGPANRPDIIIKGQKETILIDVSIPADANIIKKEAEKHLKYQSLAIEIKRMWRTKVLIKPLVIGCTGFVSEEFSRILASLPGKHSPREVQKTAILGTAHILRKTLS